MVALNRDGSIVFIPFTHRTDDLYNLYDLYDLYDLHDLFPVQFMF